MDTIPALGRYIAEAGFQVLGPEVVDVARRSTLDTFGAMLAGLRAQGIDTVAGMAMDGAGPGKPM